jgi:hypothetical protein
MFLANDTLNTSSPAFRAARHDPEDFYIKKRSKPFAITGNLTATPIAAPFIADGNPRNGSRMGKGTDPEWENVYEPGFRCF